MPRTINFLVMTKEDKIKEAYGEYWESVKLLTDENGFICQSTLFFPETVMMDKMEIQVKPFPPDGRCYWRPMTLKGIENNNGWIKIENEKDLPKEKGLKCLFLNKNNMHTTYISDDVLYDSDWFFRRYTHWKIKNEFKYPLY